MYVSVKKKSVLLYNTLNQAVVESCEPGVVKLVKRMHRGDRPRVAELDWRKVKRNKSLSGFIENARNRLMADVLRLPGDADPPFQPAPMTGLPLGNPTLVKSGGLEREGMTYLKELTLYINASCPLDCDICPRAYRQFSCCTRFPSHSGELPFQLVQKVVQETRTGYLHRININGGDIFDYKEFPALTRLLQSCEGLKTFAVHYLNLDSAINRGSFRELQNLAADPSFFFQVLVNFPIHEDTLDRVLSLLNTGNLSYRAVFAVQSQSELMRAQEVCGKIPAGRFSFSPCFNGRNLTFFKKYVFIRKSALLNSRPSMKDILARETVNHNSFGHLHIFNNGEVYANVNVRPLGNIAVDRVSQLVYKEMKQKNSWLKTRNIVRPCRDCHYCLLCPSISNYEYAVGRNNLCTIFKENDDDA